MFRTLLPYSQVIRTVAAENIKQTTSVLRPSTASMMRHFQLANKQTFSTKANTPLLKQPSNKIRKEIDSLIGTKQAVWQLSKEVHNLQDVLKKHDNKVDNIKEKFETVRTLWKFIFGTATFGYGISQYGKNKKENEKNKKEKDARAELVAERKKALDANNAKEAHAVQLQFEQLDFEEEKIITEINILDEHKLVLLDKKIRFSHNDVRLSTELDIKIAETNLAIKHQENLLEENKKKRIALNAFVKRRKEHEMQLKSLEELKQAETHESPTQVNSQEALEEDNRSVLQAF